MKALRNDRTSPAPCSDDHYASLGKAMAAHGKMLARVPSKYERTLEIHVGQLTALLYALVNKMGGKADVFVIDEVQMPTDATIRWARDGFGTIRIECSPNDQGDSQSPGK